jgi:hypothetical protein
MKFSIEQQEAVECLQAMIDAANTLSAAGRAMQRAAKQMQQALQPTPLAPTAPAALAQPEGRFTDGMSEAPGFAKEG